MEPNKCGPAFPVPSGGVVHDGMSLRDWFAGQALMGELASQSPEVGLWNDGQLAGLARRCYAVADAMLAAREK